MNDRPDGKLDALRQRIEKTVQLSAEEVDAILALPLTVRDVRAGQEIVREGDHPSQACLVLEGVSYRFKIVGEGTRQIFSYHIPGDMPDLQSLYLERMDHSLSTLTKGKVAFIPHHALHRIIQVYPRIGGYLWRETLVDGSIFREWMSNIGRRSALSRIAHVICELFVRYQAIGGVDEMTLPFPVTQNVLSDAQGLSVVHVNRVMKELKRDKLIRVERRKLTILDWDGLVSVGDFDPEYLHLRAEPKRQAS
jgi:CRP-like cAMP-binding protein